MQTNPYFAILSLIIQEDKKNSEDSVFMTVHVFVFSNAGRTKSSDQSLWLIDIMLVIPFPEQRLSAVPPESQLNTNVWNKFIISKNIFSCYLHFT